MRKKLSGAKPFHRFQENSISAPLNHQEVLIFAKSDQPRSDPVLLLKSTGICSTSHLRFTSRPPAGQHMRQHGENEKNQSQNLSESKVFVEILNFFRKAQDHLKLCFIVFFDVLELYEPSWNDLRSTLDHLFFHDFSQNFGLNNSTLHATPT